MEPPDISIQMNLFMEILHQTMAIILLVVPLDSHWLFLLQLHKLIIATFLPQRLQLLHRVPVRIRKEIVMNSNLIMCKEHVYMNQPFAHHLRFPGAYYRLKLSSK